MGDEAEVALMIAEPLRSAAEALTSRVPADTVISALVVTVGLGSMLLFEAFAPLRQTKESKIRHTIRNLGTGGIAFALVSQLQPFLLLPVIEWVGSHEVGLLNAVALPSGVEALIGVILLDYTLWWWHFSTHKVPFLWRFHLVHHIDLDLDSSTALRFHFGELVLSILYRAAQVIVIGVDFRTLWIWQTILFASILFHHGNVRLPLALERVLVRFVVTPRMHSIHHSDRREETDSNWSSLLSVWDFLHRTIVLDVPQGEIRVGVPTYQDPKQVTFTRINVLPFVRQKDDWQRADGAPALRVHEGPSTKLAE